MTQQKDQLIQHKTKMPTISVIVPIYNATDTIERCINSLQNQTLEDIEIICVDDCSTDESWELLHKLATNDERIKLFQNHENHGPAYSRRKGIYTAKGEYILCCDADDFVANDWCLRLYNEAQVDDKDIVWCDFYKQNNDGWESMWQAPSPSLVVLDEVRNLLLGKRQGALWNHLIKKEQYLNSIKYYPSHNMAEDLTILIQMYLSSKRIGYVHQPLYYYGFGIDSLSNAEQNDQKLIKQSLDMEANVSLIEKYIQDRYLEQDLKFELEYRKFFNKRWMLPALHDKHDCIYWKNCHSDINISLFKNPLISFNGKIMSFLVEIGIYPMTRRILRGR
jgi:glycosyltransferase involved in cell wall biosynthesis